MTKFFSGLAVVALLLTPLAITSPAQAVTLKVHREYGQGPVTIPAGVDRVEIVFHGREGDPVRVDERCGKVSLRGPSGRVARWIGGAWILPAPGRYSFVLALDSQGRVIDNLQNGSSDCFAQIANVVERNGSLYFGSIGEDTVGRLRLEK